MGRELATQDDESDLEPCVTILDANWNLQAQVQVLSLQREVAFLREQDRGPPPEQEQIWCLSGAASLAAHFCMWRRWHM